MGRETAGAADQGVLSVAEVRVAIGLCKRGKAPGPDRLEAVALKSMLDKGLVELTGLLNDWMDGAPLDDEVTQAR
eukprot:6295223-Prorocentrum_lima.AAC.1